MGCTHTLLVSRAPGVSPATLVVLTHRHLGASVFLSFKITKGGLGASRVGLFNGKPGTRNTRDKLAGYLYLNPMGVRVAPLSAIVVMRPAHC